MNSSKNTEIITNIKKTEINAHFKDSDTINHRSAQEKNLKRLADILKSDNYKSELIKAETKEKEHKPDHSYCDYKQTDSERVTEKRICRCFYFYNNTSDELKCRNCKFVFKKRNIGDITIIDYEVPTKYVIDGVGGIDWVLQDKGEMLAAEVKPCSSNETLVRMLAEAATYTIDTDYIPAVCFFLKDEKGSDTKQYLDYLKYKENSDFKDILKFKNFRILGIETTANTFKIIDMSDYKDENKNIDIYPQNKALCDFDTALKIQEVSTQDLKKGYVINNKNYISYMPEEKWEEFLCDMKPIHKEQFLKGGGGELKPEKNRPPKMASYASSSRMLYKLAREIPEFCFEKEMEFKIKNIKTTAYLDGFYKSDMQYIFIEAKCREIYYSKQVFEVNQKYRTVYDFINKSGIGLRCEEITEKCREGYMNVRFSLGDQFIEYFDIKQMICHLLGIATAVLNGKYSDLPIAFKYLIFNPTTLKSLENNKITEIYHETVKECKSIPYKKLFSVIIDFLTTQNQSKYLQNIDDVISNFTFEICNQADFKCKITTD